jgi:hypothetical protein
MVLLVPATRALAQVSSTPGIRSDGAVGVNVVSGQSLDQLPDRNWTQILTGQPYGYTGSYISINAGAGFNGSQEATGPRDAFPDFGGYSLPRGATSGIYPGYLDRVTSRSSDYGSQPITKLNSFGVGPTVGLTGGWQCGQLRYEASFGYSSNPFTGLRLVRDTSSFNDSYSSGLGDFGRTGRETTDRYISGSVFSYQLGVGAYREFTLINPTPVTPGAYYAPSVYTPGQLNMFVGVGLGANLLRYSGSVNDTRIISGNATAFYVAPAIGVDYSLDADWKLSAKLAYNVSPSVKIAEIDTRWSSVQLSVGVTRRIGWPSFTPPPP